MKLILQSVSQAKLTRYTEENYQEQIWEKDIQIWLLIYVGIGKDDELRSDLDLEMQKFSSKLTKLKLLEAKNGKINATIWESNAQLLVIPNFTLYWHYKSGNKIDFSKSWSFHFSQEIFERFIEILILEGFSIEKGIFGGNMLIESTNRGPINYLFEI